MIRPAAVTTPLDSTCVPCCSLGVDVDVFVAVPSTPATLVAASDDFVSEEASVEEEKEPNGIDVVEELVEALSPLSPKDITKQKRSVSFGNVHVRDHCVTLGDHPYCEEIGGYPMSLDWAHADVKEYSLDRYEETKPKRKCPRLSKEGRKWVIEDITGMDPSELEWMEEQRLLELLEEQHHDLDDNEESDDGVSAADDQDQDAGSIESRRSVTFGIVQVREHRVTLGDHPLCDSYPLTLDWAHSEVKEYDLDWYEETKREGAWYVPTGRSRMLQLEDVTGVDRSVWRWREARRLQTLKHQKLLELVAEMEQQEQKRAQKVERAAARRARALQPVRRSPRLAKEDPSPLGAVRRSARLVAKPRCQ